MICSKCQRTVLSDLNASTLPPAVSHLMTTNDPPNKHQSSAIDDELARSRANLRSLDIEIAEAQKHLLGLQAKRASLQIFVNELAGLHIRRLPIELLVRVFMLALPRDCPSPLRPEEAPLVLGQVSRLWRDVSRSTPSLWSTIHIQTIQTEEHRDAVLEWLERSRFCPLTVHAQLGDDGLEWDILAGIAARIEHLDIEVVVDKLAQLFSVDGCHRLDALQSLHLEVIYFMESLPFKGIAQIDLGTRAPRLARIHVGPDLTLQRLVLPSIQITICNLGVDDNTSFTLFLQEAVNLVDCTITIDSFNVDVSPRSPVRHTTLEKLAIQVSPRWHSNVLGSILPCLDLPSLREFQWDHIDGIHQYQLALEWPITIFLDFLSRSGCTLSKLWINSGPTEEHILRYLLEVPSVVDLEISPELLLGDSPRKLMRALTLGSQSGPEGKYLVPNLEHLTIRGRWRECDEMVQAIESRFSAAGDAAEGRRLKRVILASGLVRDNRLGHTQERLDKCVKDGLLYGIAAFH
ncbi:hypothetical protein FIBSPDRAFT_1055056 [Athelia psychrophila]|uniref:F-box domain-containing protein n=1 Tax=Athelia psychrophila TaxID=1759441 RepID=A0A167UD82_9AGAM|nr:hypothetical protein FIBSPDRAFT_1055056 [Fibularhizoctonia sp. CBS 109695]